MFNFFLRITCFLKKATVALISFLIKKLKCFFISTYSFFYKTAYSIIVFLKIDLLFLFFKKILDRLYYLKKTLQFLFEYLLVLFLYILLAYIYSIYSDTDRIDYKITDNWGSLYYHIDNMRSITEAFTVLFWIVVLDIIMTGSTDLYFFISFNKIIFFFFCFIILFNFIFLTNIFISYYFLGYAASIYNYIKISLYFLPFIILILISSFFFEIDHFVSFRFETFFFSGENKFFSFRIDNLSIIFSTTTYIIGFFTGVFQYIYMSDDLKKDRFFFFFNYFIFSMILYVHASNFVMLIFGWELLGITSFFLIAHYDLRYLTLRAAVKAFFFNRLSDVFLLVSMALQHNAFGDFFFNIDYTQLLLANNTVTFLSLLFLILASFIKSAQIFFFFWLPDSMEAPIPASALIHSATLVSAGVYLLIRFQNFIIIWPQLNYFIIFSTSLTIFIFMPVILLQTDLKKLLAFSTIVNISFLYLIVAISNSKFACCYFIVHGLFKSLSFMMLGFFILNNKHSQDIRAYGSVFFLNAFAGFLLFLSVFFLSGLNFIFIYKIKHFFDFKYAINSNFLIFIDIVFLYYSILSVFYAMKIFYYIYIKKVTNVVVSKNVISSVYNYKNIDYISKITTFYLVLSVLLSYILYLVLLNSELDNFIFIDSKILFPFFKISMPFIIYLLPISIVSVLNKKKYFFFRNIVFILLILYLFI